MFLSVSQSSVVLSCTNITVTMFALVYYHASKTTDVIHQSFYKDKFQVSKEVTVKYNGKPFKAKIIFVGTRTKCISKQSQVLANGDLPPENDKSKLKAKNDNLPSMTIFKSTKNIQLLDSSEDEESQDTNMGSTSRMNSPLPLPSFGPSRQGSISTLSSQQNNTPKKDIEEILTRIHELSGEVMELKESIVETRKENKQFKYDVIRLLKNINTTVMDSAAKRSNTYDFTILSEQKVSALFALSGGNNRKFALNLEKSIYDDDDSDLFKTVDRRVKTANKIKFITQMIELYAGLSDSPNKKDVIDSCKDALNQRSYRKARAERHQSVGSECSQETRELDVKPALRRHSSEMSESSI